MLKFVRIGQSAMAVTAWLTEIWNFNTQDETELALLGELGL